MFLFLFLSFLRIHKWFLLFHPILELSEGLAAPFIQSVFLPSAGGLLEVYEKPFYQMHLSGHWG